MHPAREASVHWLRLGHGPRSRCFCCRTKILVADHDRLCFQHGRIERAGAAMTIGVLAPSMRLLASLRMLIAAASVTNLLTTDDTPASRAAISLPAIAIGADREVLLTVWRATEPGMEDGFSLSIEMRHTRHYALNPGCEQEIGSRP